MSCSCLEVLVVVPIFTLSRNLTERKKKKVRCVEYVDFVGSPVGALFGGIVKTPVVLPG